MIEKIYNIDGAYELFRNYNGLGNENCIFYMVTEDPIDFKTIAKGVILGAALNAAGLQVVGMQQIGNYIHIELIDNPFSKRPYVNQTEYGIGFIPLRTTKPTDAINDMEIIPDSYLFIEQKDIINIKIEQKLIHSLDPSIRIVTFELSNGQSVTFRVYAKNKYVKYQESNFAKFMSRYGYSNNKPKAANKIVSILVKLVIIAIFVVPIIAVIIALKSPKQNNTSSNGNTVDTSKIKINKYNP